MNGESVNRARRIGMLDRDAVDRHHDLSGLQPGLGRRPLLGHAHHQRASHLVEAERFGDIRGHRLEGGADVGALEAGIAALKKLRPDIQITR